MDSVTLFKNLCNCVGEGHNILRQASEKNEYTQLNPVDVVLTLAFGLSVAGYMLHFAAKENYELASEIRRISPPAGSVVADAVSHQASIFAGIGAACSATALTAISVLAVVLGRIGAVNTNCMSHLHRTYTALRVNNG